MTYAIGNPSPVPRRLVATAFAALAALLPLTAFAQATTSGPSAVLVPAPPLELPGNADSNSPAIWEIIDGEATLRVLTSVAGVPTLSTGRSISRMELGEPVHFTSQPGNGVWMEAVVADEGGTWYGYYHNEVPAVDLCQRSDRVIPRIGAARSTDRGLTWDDLGIILEAPANGYDCDTTNQYFVGGVGDESVMLNDAGTDLYIFFSQYSKDPAAQGVAVARLPWADRDAPVGRVTVWHDRVWLPPTEVVRESPDDSEGSAPSVTYLYPAGTALVPVTQPWHAEGDDTDAFWGPAVHWNTFLQQYVMLVNRAKDEQFHAAGVYVAFSPSLEDPTAWSKPALLLEGGSWYPQVMGLGQGGTDKLAGARARFFLGGASQYEIEFREGSGAKPRVEGIAPAPPPR